MILANVYKQYNFLLRYADQRPCGEAWHDFQRGLRLLVDDWENSRHVCMNITALLHDAYAAVDPASLPRYWRLLPTFRAHFLAAFLCRRPWLLPDVLLLHLAPDAFHYLHRTSQKLYQRQVEALYIAPPQHVDYQGVVALQIKGGNFGGLCDKLCGAVSVFSICRAAGREFRLLFTYPFTLTDYLVPADYDWRINPDQVCMNKDSVYVHAIIDTNPSNATHALRHAVEDTRKRQTHIYTNALLTYNDDYATLFHTLFRPTPRLQSAIDAMLGRLGSDYISVSARFANLLGDFNETSTEVNHRLPEAEAEALIAKVVAGVERVHTQHPGTRLLLCSDSTRFLAATERLPYIYIEPGTITHINAKQAAATDWDTYAKTFLDFYGIAGAKHSYLLIAGDMYRSSFPMQAALVGRHQLTTLEL